MLKIIEIYICSLVSFLIIDEGPIFSCQLKLKSLQVEA
uniref:Uncharacterized protein n=1 Tax=Rhizophora mucronata TaxID=61149 RepID=A0A2P2P3S8_RHIMU